MLTKFQSQVLFLGLIFLTAVSGSAEARTQQAAYRKYSRIENGSPKTKDGLNATEREALFTHVNEHEVVGPEHVDTYEPFPGNPARAVGYCFGRAMAVHLFARTMGVKSESIQKLFIVGDLRRKGAPNLEWGFHVTTLIRDAKDASKWYAIDPIMHPWTNGKSQTVSEWIDQVRKIWDSWRPDGKPRAKLYLTKNSAIIPDASNESDPIWNPSFEPELETTLLSDSAAHLAYEVDGKFQDEHFSGADEAGQDAFPFIGIHLLIEKDKPKVYFSFKNYFVKLLNSVIRTNGVIPRPPSNGPARATTEMVAARPHGSELGNGSRMSDMRSMAFPMVPPQDLR